MKLIKLSVLFFVHVLLLSCSEQGVYVDGTSKQIVQKNEAVTQAMSRLTPKCNLLVEIDKSTQNTILERLERNVAKNWYSHRKGLSLPLINSTVRFVPVISSPMPLSSLDNPKKILKPQKEFACFYGQNEKGETIYFYAIYNDRSDFTKDTNPRMYKMNIDLFGQDYADRAVEKLRDAKGFERWEIIVASPQNPGYERFEYVRKHSEDGTFFILTRDKTYLHICCFIGKKAYYCSENDQELSMELLDNFLRR